MSSHLSGSFTLSNRYKGTTWTPIWSSSWMERNWTDEVYRPHKFILWPKDLNVFLRQLRLLLLQFSVTSLNTSVHLHPYPLGNTNLSHTSVVYQKIGVQSIDDDETSTNYRNASYIKGSDPRDFSYKNQTIRDVKQKSWTTKSPLKRLVTLKFHVPILLLVFNVGISFILSSTIQVRSDGDEWNLYLVVEECQTKVLYSACLTTLLYDCLLSVTLLFPLSFPLHYQTIDFLGIIIFNNPSKMKPCVKRQEYLLFRGINDEIYWCIEVVLSYFIVVAYSFG